MSPRTITMLLLLSATACVSVDATELDEAIESESTLAAMAAIPTCTQNPGVSSAVGRTRDGDRPGRIEVDLLVFRIRNVDVECKADVTMTSLNNDGDPIYKVVPTLFYPTAAGVIFEPFSKLDNHPSTFLAQVCIITGSSSSCKQVNVKPGRLPF